MEAGTQAAHRFNRQVSRVTHGQQLALFVTLDALNGFDAVTGLLPLGERDAGVHADPVLFQHLRAFDTAVEQRAQQHADDGKHQAENNTAEDNQRLLRLQHARLGNRRVNDTHVADGAGFGDFQLLLFVQQLHVNLLAGFHITRQAYNFLLRLRHRGHAVIQLRLLFFQGTTFLQQSAVRRVTFGIELGNLRLFEGQLVQLRINIHHGVENRFRLQRQIDGILVLTVRVQLVLCVIQTGAHLRQLFTEKRQAFCGFR
ncbi:Uncharacterised protein [Enterobacter hormaechei]|nr:Uncharacterised protein [Enterobacter hormaechei]